ncbi:FK506-binding protein 4-like [Dendronephthya gigantea]|uniref:FK506-binding protein 4-like n=1 Tax=Dendronephthya gigantea TaxID=151771 RepID=UPI0010691292|nr:FK506-binding protein 4-like [Dendronephthya gigantea]
MFWGISLEVGKRYSQTVEKSFHISMAALTATSDAKGAVTVMVEVEKACYPICTLKPGKIPQQALDYIFTEGEEVLFYTEGDLDVHLTGYLIDEPSPFEYSTEDDESGSESNAVSSDDENEANDRKRKKSDNEEETLDSLISELDGLNEDNENKVDIWLERSARKKQRNGDLENDTAAAVGGSSLSGLLLYNEDSEESEDNDWIPGGNNWIPEGKRKLKKKQKSEVKEKRAKQTLKSDINKKIDSESDKSPSKLNTSKTKQKNPKKKKSSNSKEQEEK